VYVVVEEFFRFIFVFGVFDRVPVQKVLLEHGECHCAGGILVELGKHHQAVQNLVHIVEVLEGRFRGLPLTVLAHVARLQEIVEVFGIHAQLQVVGRRSEHPIKRVRDFSLEVQEHRFLHRNFWGFHK